MTRDAAGSTPILPARSRSRGRSSSMSGSGSTKTLPGRRRDAQMEHARPTRWAVRSCSSPPRSRPTRRSTSGAGRSCAGRADADAMGQFGKLTSLDDLAAGQELDSADPQGRRTRQTAPAPRKTKHAPKPPPELHPEFAAALAKAPKAKAALDGFPPRAPSATISSGYQRRSSPRPGPSASPPRSNG